jgi:hypothetical protein
MAFESHESPGYTQTLTAAVRDLHLCHPGKFVTNVVTPSPYVRIHAVASPPTYFPQSPA